MEEIIKQLCERFPLLSRLTVTQAGNNSIPESLPPFLGFLLAVMDTPPSQPLCFVLPRRGDVARLGIVLFALHRFIRKQKQLTHAYGATNFSKGDNVRVHPGKQVFRYDGFDEISPEFIWLKTVDGTGRWQFRATEIIPRLERTTRKTPIGRLNSPIPSPPPAPLDVLLETSTFGNLSLLQNEVVLLDSQSGFADFADTVAFQRASLMPDMPSLKALLPFGELSPPFSSKQAWLKKWDDRNPAGEPLVAITHSAELLANYCIDAPAKSKLVVINGLSRLKHRQSYDDAAESQRLVLFASQDEEEMINTLGQAPIPCKFWWLSAAEINAGGGLAGANGSPGLVNKVVRWANNHERLDIESVPCENQELETVCIRLEELRGQLSDDENDPLTKLTSLAWRMLNDASAIVRPLTVLEQKRFATQVGSLRAELKNNVWLKPESAKVLNDIASAIEASLLADAKLGLSKGAALYRVVRESQTARLKCALLARNENQIEELKLWMRQRSISLETYSPRTLPEDSVFDRLICISWPGWYSLKQIADILVAPRITVLAYPFEGRWLSQCKRRLRLCPDVPTVTAAEKTVLVATDKSTPAIWLEDNATKASPPSMVSTDTGIWHFEQRLRAARKGIAASPAVVTDTVPARYVSFIGDCYAFLTESHKLPVATALVSGSARANQKLPERTVLDIKPGDFIVFPESGNREFVLEVADKRIGPPASKLRKLARKWKAALQNSGLSPEQFYQQAKSFNRPRHIATIRYWFADNSQIGPREKDDLVLIALVTGDKELESETDDVRLAIESLWSAHQSAGVKLRDALLQKLPQVMGQVEENGTQVDLDELGSAWIVQVDAIASNDELRGRSEINRLLRERPTFNSVLLV
ncbi:MAG TPA: DrmE family protein [Verrucomicrobiae bacterium]|jgi:hypothetical protein|nr:DrmE family protein [Verrucomicrobiae bacterium]